MTINNYFSGRDCTSLPYGTPVTIKKISETTFKEVVIDHVPTMMKEEGLVEVYEYPNNRYIETIPESNIAGRYYTSFK